MLTNWIFHDPRMTLGHLGLIPTFISQFDPRPAKEQINENYTHGGGWFNYDGYILQEDGTLTSQYEGEDLKPLAEAKLRDEVIRFYDHAWVSIKHPDGTYSVARID